MATHYVISYQDQRELGSFDELKALILKHFPSVEFYWTTSGPEKLQLAKEKGIVFPPVIAESLKTLPALLEGVAQSDEWAVMFGLGPAEPVRELICEPHGDAEILEAGLRAIETVLGVEFRINGTPPLK